jgi:hypothetical protein
MKKLRKPSLSRAWTPAKATEEIRKLAQQDFNFCWTNHFREQLDARGLVVGDVTHVLKNGFVYEDAEPSTRKGFFKYKMECTTPNSGRRVVRVVVIPQLKPPEFKIVTVMWVDE